MEMYNEINVAFMPAGTISIVYPMDQGVILTFKSYYLRNTFYMAATTMGGDFSDGSQQQAPKIFWKGFAILDAVINVASGRKSKPNTNRHLKESQLQFPWRSGTGPRIQWRA